jgi:class 3 adenylate cyclase
MDRLARWLLGFPRQWAWWVRAILVIAPLPLEFGAVLVTASTFRIKASWSVIYIPQGVALGTVGLFLCTVFIGRAELGLISRWIRSRDLSEATVVREAVLRIEKRSLVRMAWALFAVLAVYLVYVDRRFIGGSFAAYAALVTGILGVVASGLFVDIIMWQALTRPIIEELDAALVDEVTAGSPLTLSFRITALVAIGFWGGGFLASGAAVRFHSPTAEFAVAAVVGPLGALAYIVATLRPVIRSVIVHPVRELIDGTRRVSAGDLSRRVPVGSFDELGTLARSFNIMQRGLAERERLQSAFGSYVDPMLAERLLAQDDALFAGEDVEVTCFFADVRNFTSFSENATPQESVARLNMLFDVVVPILIRHHGHANKYLGDGLLAVFGVPELIPDHAERAVVAACEIQDAVRATFGAALRIGIGINTGRVVAGTIGGGGKLEFTLIGDTVNVAARVEELTKTTGDAILLTETTAGAVAARDGDLLTRGHFPIRGRNALIQLYTLSGYQGPGQARPSDPGATDEPR